MQCPFAIVFVQVTRTDRSPICITCNTDIATCSEKILWTRWAVKVVLFQRGGFADELHFVCWRQQKRPVSAILLSGTHLSLKIEEPKQPGCSITSLIYLLLVTQFEYGVTSCSVKGNEARFTIAFTLKWSLQTGCPKWQFWRNVWPVQTWLLGVIGQSTSRPWLQICLVFYKFYSLASVV